MKTFSSEFVHDYGSYSFGYCNYAVYEKNDVLSDIYAKGYLPYSGSGDVWNTFYMARSTRINLPSWELNSENRRVLRAHDEQYTRAVYEKSNFETDDEFKKFCLSYFERHHGTHAMPRERLEHILKEEILTTIVEYKEGTTLVGYVFLAKDQKMSHVWFYFYAEGYAQSSFGMWILLNEAQEAKSAGREFFYIGTAYGDKSRYKTNISPLEFWDGSSWLQDEKNSEMKSRTKNDDLNLVQKTDVYKKDKKNFF